jgi:hypothetical protein
MTTLKHLLDKSKDNFYDNVAEAKTRKFGKVDPRNPNVAIKTTPEFKFEIIQVQQNQLECTDQYVQHHNPLSSTMNCRRCPPYRSSSLNVTCIMFLNVLKRLRFLGRQSKVAGQTH